MYIYLFNAKQELPKEYVNGPADPATFMSIDQLRIATVYSRIKDFLFFIGIPWEWAIYLLILGLGLSASFLSIAKRVSKKSFLVQSGIYVAILSVFVTILQFPLYYYSYKVSRDYGINIQSVSSWLADKGKGFLLDLFLTIPMVWLLYVMLRKSPKRWWLWFWLISIPLTVLLFFIQPVIIDPIFNDFQYLQDQNLKEDILALARKADIPTDQVYQVNMSKKTTALNAYVTGIGANARIVLWDTTLSKLNKDEILFIMAHEMGHYVYRHVYWMLLGFILSSLFILYLVNKLINWLVKKYGHLWRIKSVGDISSLPLFLLVLSILTFLISPIENTISREAERAADAYAISITHDKEGAISAFQKLAVESLVEPNPPKIVKFFLYSHPTMVERIYTLNKYE
ncbi:hypothetical protein BHF71_02135 [Vulcanibacillus modesticaldus]|uniref:Peptidase M48 n=2 Tax=Vulcanibacillus modesticaldus TaxID=337097 RepID=A0A1D2YUX3_9BACI|nr:hypothetical protein BHF71_02135 [Vulcanibacillus modesticaldus]